MEQAPNYLLCATPEAFHFKTDKKDWVLEEMTIACRNYEHDHEVNRVITVVVPSVRIEIPKDITQPNGEKEWKQFSPPGTDELPDVIKPLGQPNRIGLQDTLPNGDELQRILEAVTKINRHNMWNAGYRWLEESQKAGRRFSKLDIVENILPLAGEKPKAELPQHVQLQETPGEDGKGEKQPLMDRLHDTEGHVYLIGPGGIGKTTALMHIMREHYAEPYEETKQIPLFVELSGAPDIYDKLYQGGKSTFIRRSIYRQVRNYRTTKHVTEADVGKIDEVFVLDPETAVIPVNDLLTKETNAPEYLLLLDGLNETPRTDIRIPNKNDPDDIRRLSVIEMVRDEINWLMRECPNVKVVITGRADEQAVMSDRLTRLLLSGIGDDEIREYLRGANFSEEEIKAVVENSTLFETIRTPLFLTMYAKLRDRKDTCTQGEIFHTFFSERERTVADYSEIYTQQSHLVEMEEEAKRGEQPPKIDADMQAFMIDFLLPVVGREMEKKGLFHLHKKTIGDLIWPVLTETDDTAVCGDWGQSAFSKYSEQGNGSTHTQAVAENLLTAFGENKSKFTDFFVTYCSMALGILSENGTTKQFGFVHQHIQDYFAALEVINSLKIGVTAFENDDKETALDVANGELKDDVLGFTVRRFIGESLGEHHNKPWCDEEGNWHYNVPDARSKDNATLCERNLLTRALNIYRGRFDGEDGYGQWNMIQILKEVRDDLSGEDFSRLDLTGIRLNGYCLGQRRCSANISCAKVEKEVFMPGGHTDCVYSAEFSSDGKRIVTASRDDTAKVWDAETLREIGTLEGHTSWVESATYSPDGKRIVTASEDHTAKVWDAKNLREIGTLEGHEYGVNLATFSPDGRWIVTASNDWTAKVWDAETLQEIGTLRGHEDGVNLATFSPDGRWIVTASNDWTAKVWDTETFRERRTLEGHRGYVQSAAYSPDGRWIVTASGDMTAKVWDAETFQEIGTLKGHTNRVYSATYSPDGSRIVTASFDRTVKIWDTETFRELGMSKGHREEVFSAEFSPDGSRIVTTSEEGTAKVWDAETLRNLGTLKGHKERIYSVAYSLDGRWIVTASNDMTSKIWSAVSFQELGTLKGHTDGILSAKFNLDGNRIVTASIDHTAKVWDAEAFRELGTLKGHIDEVDSAVYSLDRNRIVTASWDGTAKVWNAVTFQELGMLTGHKYGIASITFNPDESRILTASPDETAKVWDATTLREIGTLKGHANNVNSGAYSPDGRWIVTASRDETAKVWNAVTLREIGTLEGHKKNVKSAAFSSDGRLIVTASWDGTAKIWSVSTFDCLHTIRNVPGLEVLGCDFRHLHPDSKLSDEDKQLLWEYGARFNDEDTPPCRS